MACFLGSDSYRDSGFAAGLDNRMTWPNGRDRHGGLPPVTGIDPAWWPRLIER
jgi:hypothetical protein